jgi:hypothetical protein
MDLVRSGLCLSFGISLLAATVSAPAAVPEEEARAAFLYQLAQYVEWPVLPRAGEPLRFCVLGDEDLAQTLARTVNGKTIDGRPIQVRGEGDDQGRPCHLIYIAWTRERQLKDMLSHWKYPPALLVGEADRFNEFGGMVNLVIAAGRVGFELCPENAQRAGLQFRSQLLRFARQGRSPAASRR